MDLISNITSKLNPTNTDLMTAITMYMDLNNTQLQEIKKCSNQINHNLESAVVDIKSEIGRITGRVNNMENELSKANALIDTLNSEINFIKQKNIEKDVIISGIPNDFNDHEDFLNKLCKIFNFNLKNIESHYLKKITFKRSGRSGSGTMNQLCITFKDKVSKDAFMSSVRSNGPLQVKQIYPQYAKLPAVISIREKLSSMNMQMFKKLLELKKKKKICYCWFRQNNIYVKITTNESEKPQIIRSLNDVTKIEQQ